VTLAFGDPTSVQIPTIITDRLVLRSWRPADVLPYSLMNSDDETMRYLKVATKLGAVFTEIATISAWVDSAVYTFPRAARARRQAESAERDSARSPTSATDQQTVADRCSARGAGRADAG
jgi:RimJ/RimL family protein N-acetyltransferase